MESPEGLKQWNRRQGFIRPDRVSFCRPKGGPNSNSIPPSEARASEAFTTVSSARVRQCVVARNAPR